MASSLPIPPVVLLLFLFTFLSLLLQNTTPSLIPASATIKVASTNHTFTARPAAFGPVVAVSGEIFIANTGCSGDSKNSDMIDTSGAKGKVVVIKRGGCGFLEKVAWVQKIGGVAAVVGDTLSSTTEDGKHNYGGDVRDASRLVTMYAKGDTSSIEMPSFFVTHDTYLFMLHTPFVRITPIPQTSSLLSTLVFLLLSPLVTLSILYTMLVIRRRWKAIRERTPESFVRRLPVRVVGEKESGECVVCLEEWYSGKELMRLPCSHEFCVGCISPWLIQRKRLCPICKRDVTRSAFTDESTPLIDSGPSDTVSCA